MGKIYIITNSINNKKYIGQTKTSLEKRLYNHCKDAKRKDRENRPLYAAFNKYGIENFKITLLEEVSSNAYLNDREKFWIKELNTFGKNGYNSTLGGDGTLIYDHKKILELYNMGYSVPMVANKINCDPTTVLKVLKVHGIKSRGNSHQIDQYDKIGNYIQTFDSTSEARNWLIYHQITKN